MLSHHYLYKVYFFDRIKKNSIKRYYFTDNYNFNYYNYQSYLTDNHINLLNEYDSIFTEIIELTVEIQTYYTKNTIKRRKLVSKLKRLENKKKRIEYTIYHLNDSNIHDKFTITINNQGNHSNACIYTNNIFRYTNRYDCVHCISCTK